MKKIAAILLLAAMLLSLCACTEPPATTGTSLSPSEAETAGTTLAPTVPTEPDTTEPSVTEPPATEPPATEPPATEPPATEPPATEPPATEPPATEPPATEPPATEPPATEPPATEPPATEPPATEPPATECSHDYQITCSVEATCTEFGKLTYQCSKCGHSYQMDLPKADHAFANATCTEPKTCTVCGATEGKANGHKWTDATCLTPKTCTVCAATEGKATGHKWTDATCLTPKTCSVCAATEGSAKGHQWTDATCQAPKTCSVCAATEGNVADHKYQDNACIYCGIADPDATSSMVVIHSAKSNGYVTGQIYVYTSSSGKQKQELVMDGAEEKAIAFKQIEHDDGTVSFQTSSGKYLFCDGTHVTFADEDGDYTRFVLEPVDSAYYIRCAVATYNSNPQYLEIYSGYLTCFSMSETSNKQYYTFTLQDGADAKGTIVEPSEGEDKEDDNQNADPTDPSIFAQSIANGDQVVIVATAHNKALSSQPSSAGSYYQMGVDVTAADGTLTGYGATEIWTVIVNADGTYSFSYNGQNLGMQDSFSSMSLGAVNDKWELVALDNGSYALKNVARGNYIEWYASKNNWSTYTCKDLQSNDLFHLSFFIVN